AAGFVRDHFNRQIRRIWIISFVDWLRLTFLTDIGHVRGITFAGYPVATVSGGDMPGDVVFTHKQLEEEKDRPTNLGCIGIARHFYNLPADEFINFITRVELLDKLVKGFSRFDNVDFVGL